MSGKGTGVFGFADYSQPIIRRGYDKGKTDQVIRKFRQNEQDYLRRIEELEYELKLALAQRNGFAEAFYELCDIYGIAEADGDEIAQPHLRREKMDMGLSPDAKFE
jgi:hypothetical protein